MIDLAHAVNLSINKKKYVNAYSGPKTESSALANNTTGSFLQLVRLYLVLSLLDTFTAVS